MPERFAIKTTHDSAGVVNCEDKQKLNIDEAKKKLRKGLKKNYFWAGREWPYKNVKPQIIVEEFIDLSGKGCAEYKFFCFGGKIKVVLVCTGKVHSDGNNGRTNTFYDENFNRLPLKILNPNAEEQQRKPPQYDEMAHIAEVLSEGFPHVRIDLYLTGGKIYFGEFTFFHNSGFNIFEPEEYDLIWGEWIAL